MARITLSDKTSTSALKTPKPKEHSYGEELNIQTFLPESPKETVGSNLLASAGFFGALCAGAALIGVAASAPVSLPILFTAFATLTLLGAAVAPSVNNLVSGKGTERDPRNYVESQKEKGKLKSIENVPDDVSTNFFTRPSMKMMIGGALAGIAIGAISFAFPIAPALAVSAMFGTSFLSAAFAGAYSATVTPIKARLNYEGHIHNAEVSEAGSATISKTKEQLHEERIESAIDREFKNHENSSLQQENNLQQDALATEALTNTEDLEHKSSIVKKIIEQREKNPRTTKSFVENELAKRSDSLGSMQTM